MSSDAFHDQRLEAAAGRLQRAQGVPAEDPGKVFADEALQAALAR